MKYATIGSTSLIIQANKSGRPGPQLTLEIQEEGIELKNTKAVSLVIPHHQFIT